MGAWALPQSATVEDGPRNYEDIFRDTLASGLEGLPGYVEAGVQAWGRRQRHDENVVRP
jgi:hypothetical protein